MNHKAITLLALRASLALLMLVWGLDKFANPGHGAAVAERFYGGVLAGEGFMPLLGSLQIVLAVGLGVGVFRRFLYPVLVGVTGVTLLGVWRSVVDPWGWFLEDTNALFFPSLIVFAGALVLLAFMDEDVLRPGGSRASAERAPPGSGSTAPGRA